MTRHESYKVAAETGIHPRTVMRWATGGAVESATAYALAAAARKLRIDVAPAAKPGAHDG